MVEVLSTSVDSSFECNLEQTPLNRCQQLPAQVCAVSVVRKVSMVEVLSTSVDSSFECNLEQTPLNRCQQLPARYKRLIHDRNETNKQTSNRPT